MLSRRCLFLAGLLAVLGVSRADEPKAADPNGVLKKPAAPTGQPMTLAECLAIADQRQPKIRAAYHSLRAAELGIQGLNSLGRVFERLSPDLPVRRLQASLGLRVSQAEVEKVRQETAYDVTFLYFSHVYARQSEQTAADVVEQLDVYYRFAEDFLNSGVREPKSKIDKQSLQSLQIVIAEVRTLRLEAETKRRQTLVALKLAMGVGQECDFHPATKQLPVMGEDGAGLTEAMVIRWAVERRPEVVQAATALEVFTLEACAQSKIRYRPQVNTLAAGTDLHSRPVPLPLRNGQWRPGALAPEMPNSLVGSTDDRVARASEYAARQAAQYEDTLALVQAEGATAFIEWDAATVRMGLAKKRFEAARQALDEARAAASTQLNPQLLVTAEANAGRAQADYVRAVYDHLTSLAKLQRVTAGALRLNFDAARTAAEPRPKTDGDATGR